MKVTLYLDYYPGMDVKYLCAFTNPGEKSPNIKRYAFTVDLGNIHEIDEHAEVNAAEIVE